MTAGSCTVPIRRSRPPAEVDRLRIGPCQPFVDLWTEWAVVLLPRWAERRLRLLLAVSKWRRWIPSILFLC